MCLPLVLALKTCELANIYLWFMVYGNVNDLKKNKCITKETVEQWTVLYVPNISLELQMYCHVRNAAPCTVLYTLYSTV